MRAVNIVGFKDCGKTTLCANLIEALEGMGHKVAALKFTHQAGLDKAGTDTHKLMAHSLAVGAIGEGESAMFWRGKRPLQSMLPLLDAELVVVEGGKDLGVMGRIVIAKNADQARELGAGPGGLAFAVYGPEGLPGVPAVQNVADLAALVAERAFLLPGINCEGCGRATCAAFAADVVAGKAAADDCQALGGSLTITVDGSPVALGPFVSRMLRAGLVGMLGELKGYVPGKDTIITLKR